MSDRCPATYPGWGRQCVLDDTMEAHDITTTGRAFHSTGGALVWPATSRDASRWGFDLGPEVITYRTQRQ